MKVREKYNAKFLAFVFVLAVALGVAEAAGEGWQDGLRGFAIMMGFWLLVPLIPWDGLELLQKLDRDERQGALGIEAMAVAGGAMAAAALVGAAIDVAHGRDGGFLIICGVGGISYFAACLILPRVRR